MTKLADFQPQKGWSTKKTMKRMMRPVTHLLKPLFGENLPNIYSRQLETTLEHEISRLSQPVGHGQIQLDSTQVVPLVLYVHMLKSNNIHFLNQHQKIISTKNQLN